MNRWYLDPLLRGTYPGRHARAPADARRADPEPGDMAAMHLGLDFGGREPLLPRLRPPRSERAAVRGHASSPARPSRTPSTLAMGWGGVPRGVPREFSPACVPSTAIRSCTSRRTAALPGRPLDGRPDPDPSRIAYLDRHLAQVAPRIDEGAGVARLLRVDPPRQLRVGPKATAKRFGLFYTDYETMARIPKDSRCVVPRRGLPPMPSASMMIEQKPPMHFSSELQQSASARALLLELRATRRGVHQPLVQKPPQQSMP